LKKKAINGNLPQIRKLFFNLRICGKSQNPAISNQKNDLVILRLSDFEISFDA